MKSIKDILNTKSKIKHVVFTALIPHTIYGSQLWSNWRMAEVVSNTLDPDQKLAGIEWLEDGFEVTYTQTEL